MTKLEQMQAYARRIYDTTGSEDQWLEEDLPKIVTEVWNEAIKECERKCDIDSYESGYKQVRLKNSKTPTKTKHYKR